jgi:hypothetical protein
MSADLLRRAAAKLRRHAEAAPEGPWVSLDDGDRLVALRPDSTFEKGFRYLVDEPIDDTSIAEYFALMHPPVARALAELLDYSARWFESAERDGYEYDDDEALPIIAVARAILREPEETS